MIKVVHTKHLSKAKQKYVWETFLKGGTNHSAQAMTLTYIIERCEQEKMPYELQAVPGIGYTIKPKPEWKIKDE